MDGRSANTWLIAALAIAVGFLAALLIFGGDDNNNSSATVNGTTATNTGTTSTDTTANGATTAATTTVTGQGAAPQSPQASTDSCIALWNQPNNRGNQTFVVNLGSQQAVRVHVGATSDVPPKCLVTVIANNGDAYVFPEGGGNTYPYAQLPGKSDGSTLPPAQKTSNALDQSDGTLKAR